MVGGGVPVITHSEQFRLQCLSIGFPVETTGRFVLCTLQCWTAKHMTSKWVSEIFVIYDAPSSHIGSSLIGHPFDTFGAELRLRCFFFA